MFTRWWREKKVITLSFSHRVSVTFQSSSSSPPLSLPTWAKFSFMGERNLTRSYARTSITLRFSLHTHIREFKFTLTPLINTINFLQINLPVTLRETKQLNSQTFLPLFQSKHCFNQSWLFKCVFRCNQITKTQHPMRLSFKQTFDQIKFNQLTCKSWI